MGYKKAEKHTIAIGFAATNPADSTEYRFLTDTDPLTTHPFTPHLSLDNIVITRIFLSMKASANFTDEAWDIIFRNSTTTTDIISMTIEKDGAGLSSGKCIYEGGLLCSGSARYQFKTTTPAWVTNPTAAQAQGYIEYIQL